jgi:hypothetical protein
MALFEMDENFEHSVTSTANDCILHNETCIMLVSNCDELYLQCATCWLGQ